MTCWSWTHSDYLLARAAAAVEEIGDILYGRTTVKNKYPRLKRAQEWAHKRARALQKLLVS